MIDKFGNILFEEKYNPFSSNIKMDEYSSGNVDCYRVKKRFVFCPKNPDVPNQVAQCLDYAFRRGRVLLLNKKITSFNVTLTITTNDEWPHVVLVVKNDKNNQEKET